MGTTDVSSMGLVHILQTTQSKHYSHVLYRIGARSMLPFYSTALYSSDTQPRCIAPPNDLDRGDGGPHSHMHTDTLLRTGTITLRELWDSYGIVGDLLVSKNTFSLPPC